MIFIENHRSAPKGVAWGQAYLLLFIFALISVVGTAHAQVTPVETVAGYKIAHVDSADVCFAVLNATSQNDKAMAFSYYRAKTGQRWQVAGYLSALDHPAETDTLTISFDGDDKLTRNVEFRDGDYMIPFEALAELEAYEADVAKSETLTLGLKDDALTIPLPEFRQAIDAVKTCLESPK